MAEEGRRNTPQRLETTLWGCYGNWGGTAACRERGRETTTTSGKGRRKRMGRDVEEEMHSLRVGV